MKSISSYILAVGLPLTAVAATGAAVAFWTGSAGGSATATAAADADKLVLAPKTALTGLVPGGSVTSDVTAKNNNASTSVSITGLTVGEITSNKTDCTAAVSGAAAKVTVPSAAVIVAPGATVDYGSVTISMANLDVNQDACKGASFSVTLASS